MSKRLIAILLAATLAWSAWAQEETPAEEAADSELSDDAAEASGEPADSGEVEDDDAPYEGVLEEAFEDASLDEQTYEDDDDDFVPTEEIPADEPIPFPSNI
jgi:hypothetical protein